MQTRTSIWTILAGVLLIITFASWAATLASLLGYLIPVHTDLTAFTSATATFSLVVITIWYAYETRQARVQAISPSFGLRIIPHSPEYIKSQLFVINYGTGVAHNLKATLQFFPGSQEQIVAETPMLEGGHEMKSGHFSDLNFISSKEEMEKEYEGIRLHVSYINQLGEKHNFKVSYQFEELVQQSDPVHNLSERLSS